MTSLAKLDLRLVPRPLMHLDTTILTWVENLSAPSWWHVHNIERAFPPSGRYLNARNRYTYTQKSMHKICEVGPNTVGRQLPQRDTQRLQDFNRDGVAVSTTRGRKGKVSPARGMAKVSATAGCHCKLALLAEYKKAMCAIAQTRIAIIPHHFTIYIPIFTSYFDPVIGRSQDGVYRSTS